MHHTRTRAIDACTKTVLQKCGAFKQEERFTAKESSNEGSSQLVVWLIAISPGTVLSPS